MPAMVVTSAATLSARYYAGYVVSVIAVATLATAATTPMERALERGDKSGDCRRFRTRLPGRLDRLFEWV